MNMIFQIHADEVNLSDKLLLTIRTHPEVLTENVENGAGYTNIVVELDNPVAYWDHIRPQLKKSPIKMIVVAEGDNGWDDYNLFYHFDKTQKLDELV